MGRQRTPLGPLWRLSIGSGTTDASQQPPSRTSSCPRDRESSSAKGGPPLRPNPLPGQREEESLLRRRGRPHHLAPIPPCPVNRFARGVSDDSSVWCVLTHSSVRAEIQGPVISWRSPDGVWLTSDYDAREESTFTDMPPSKKQRKSATYHPHTNASADHALHGWGTSQRS